MDALEHPILHVSYRYTRLFFFFQKIDFIELAIFDTSQRAVGHFTPALNLSLHTNWIQVIT